MSFLSLDRGSNKFDLNMEKSPLLGQLEPIPVLTIMDEFGSDFQKLLGQAHRSTALSWRSYQPLLLEVLDGVEFRVFQRMVASSQDFFEGNPENLYEEAYVLTQHFLNSDAVFKEIKKPFRGSENASFSEFKNLFRPKKKGN